MKNIQLSYFVSPDHKNQIRAHIHTTTFKRCQISTRLQTSLTVCEHRPTCVASPSLDRGWNYFSIRTRPSESVCMFTNFYFDFWRSWSFRKRSSRARYIDVSSLTWLSITLTRVPSTQVKSPGYISKGICNFNFVSPPLPNLVKTVATGITGILGYISHNKITRQIIANKVQHGRRKKLFSS